MPSLKHLPDRFSLQGCEVSEGVAVPLKRKKPRSGDAFGTELFSRKARVPDARNEHRHPCLEVARLSIGHNDTVLPPKAPKPVVSRKLKVYRGASLGEVPGIPNHGHSSGGNDRPKSKRGKVLAFSESSRRNLQASLAKVRIGVDLYTMMLSCPGFLEHLTHALVKAAFLRFLKRLTAKAARDSRFRELAGFWKQELQQRGALHFHFVFAGVVVAEMEAIQRWIAEQWVECVLDIPGMPGEIVEEEKRKMLAVHGHSKNFEKVRGDFQGYFAKYLGKADDLHSAENPIPGRWWGKFNSAFIPVGKLQELELPERVAVHAQRVARKIRQARGNHGRHYQLCRKHDMLDLKGKPLVSRFALMDAANLLKSLGGLSALDNAECDSWGKDRPERRLLSRCGVEPLVFLLKLKASGDSLGSVLGPLHFPAAMKFSSVRLTGAHVPEMMIRIVQYAGARALIDRDQSPF